MAWVNDTFGGSGGLGAHWTSFNDSATVNSPAQVSGRYELDIVTGDDTDSAWFNDGTNYVGRLDYQVVQRPVSGTDFYYFDAVGIGPPTAPADDFTVLAGFHYLFTAIIAHDGAPADNSAAAAYEFAAIGQRDEQLTIERKSKSASASSNQNDVGDLGPSSKFNIRVGIPSSGNLTWAYQAEEDDPLVDAWTDLITAGSGWPGTRQSYSGDIYLGIAPYAFETISTSNDFTGSVARAHSSVADSDTAITFNKAYTRLGPGGVPRAALVPAPDVDQTITFSKAYTRLGPGATPVVRFEDVPPVASDAAIFYSHLRMMKNK